MVNRMPPSMSYPVAPRYRTTLNMERIIDFAPSAGTFTGYMDINFNNIALPFVADSLNVYDGANMVGAGSVTEGQYSGITTADAGYAGFTQLYNESAVTLYNSCRVKAVSLAIQVYPAILNLVAGSTSANLFYVGSVPWLLYKGNAEASQAPTTIDQLRQTPNSKMVGVQAGSGGNRQNTFKNYCTLRKLIGCTKSAIEDDLSQGTFMSIFEGENINPSQFDGQWRVVWASSSSSSGAVIPQFTLAFKLRAYCEFFNSSYGQLSQ